MQAPLVSIIVPYWGYGLPADQEEYDKECDLLLAEHLREYKEQMLSRTYMQRYFRIHYGVDFSEIGKVPSPKLPGHYNSDWLQEALASAYAQRYPNFEVVHGLPPGKKWNLSKARNYLISKSKGEYIVCLDADDKLHEDYISQCLNIVMQTKCDIAHPPFTFFGDQHFVACAQELNVENYAKDNTLPYCCLYSRKVWDRYHYAEDMKYGYEDWDFWHAALANGFNFKLVPFLIFFYRKVGASMVDSAHENRDYNFARMTAHHPHVFTGAVRHTNYVKFTA